ncbi:site-specific integrase [Streptomyces sp. NBC_01803]|uniref:site-specific integrase n=1 Tax=Streptomyces sp. NBC_01803 TaxID=2975946 RepID=UPI002DD8A815|nr:tyrosine-type recombinase/integrase [Streptomyces sp. NBC_01803]WSA45014.1 site-specific integrase [Streptomyces sp. NBC_01803]
MKGSTYRRCYCRGEDGRPLGKTCPQLTSKRHGTWAVRQELPPREDGGRRSFSRSGYTSAAKAQEVLDQVRALLALPDHDDLEALTRLGDRLEEVSKDKKAPLPDPSETRRRLRRGQKLTSTMTVADLLEEWLEAKRKAERRKTTLNGYASHVRVHLIPGIGDVRLDRLTVGHCQAMFDAIDDRNDVIAAENRARREQAARCKWTKKKGRPPAAERAKLDAEREQLAGMPPFRKLTGPATKQAIRRTLRTALNYAIGREYYTSNNPARFVELATARRPKGLLWTAERVERWRETGEKPSPVMVWTPVQLGAFLDAAEDEPLYACFHLIAYHGLRRGEAVGQEWGDIDFQRKVLTVAKEITVDGWTPYESAPKTDGSAGAVRIDSGTVAVLQAHRLRQQAQREKRLEAGLPWTDTGKVFTAEDGAWLHPETVSDEFRRIVAEEDLPPINLRDLRHGAAALVKAGGGDLHDAKEKLRHSSITLTSDTYMALFEEATEELTEKAAAVVPRARRAPAGTGAHASLTQEPGNS